MENTSAAEIIGVDIDAVEFTPAEALELDERTDRSSDFHEDRARYLLTAIVVGHRMFGREDLLTFLIRSARNVRRS